MAEVREPTIEDAAPFEGVDVRPTNAGLPARMVAASDAFALALALALKFSVAGLVFGVAAWIALGGAYRGSDRLTRSLIDRLPALWGRVGIGALVALPVAAVWGGVRPLATASIVAVLLVPLTRLVVHMAIARLRRNRTVVEPTVVVGTSLAGIDIVEILQRDSGYGLTPVGFLEDGTKPDLPVPVIGSPDDLPAVAAQFGIRRAIMACSAVSDARLVSIARIASEHGIDLYVVPRLFELGAGTEASDEVIGYPLVRLPASTLAAQFPMAKRVFDVVASAVLLIVASPLMALSALAIRLTDGPPVLFRQKRIGRNGVPFELLKFRTMGLNDDADTTWSVASDVRVTPVGRVLRASSLDELPQLFNVFRGDMSLVGPRPERPYFVEQFRTKIPRYDERHRVPGGITGLAQVHGLRGDTSIRHRVRLDNAYIDRWSLWRDLSIVVRTFLQMIRDGLKRVTHGTPRSADERGVVAPSPRPRAEVDDPDHPDEELG